MTVAKQDSALTTSLAEVLPPRTSVFLRMWAVAHIVHLVAATGSQLDSIWNIATVAFALAVLCRPNNGKALAIMMVAQVCDYVTEMPFSPDHWALITLINLTMLSTMLARRSTSAGVVTSAFPTVRALLIIVYLAAALSKYNTTFLNPMLSCANAIASTASFGLSKPLENTSIFIVAVLLTETAIPILLVVPRTRRHAVRIGLLFHFVLSASPSFAVVDFTTALYAVFLLFLSDDDLARLLDLLRKFASRSAIVRHVRQSPGAIAILAFVCFGFVGYAQPALASALTYVIAEVYVVTVLAAGLASWRFRSGSARLGLPGRWHIAILVLAVAWALNPYLGLRTTGVFSMFSSLKTEGDTSNHLFMPNLRLTTWQDDLVVIKDSSDPALASAGERGLAVPLMGLRRAATDDPNLEVEGYISGRAITFGPEDEQTHLEPLPWWQYRLLLFRPTPAQDQRFCSIS